MKKSIWEAYFEALEEHDIKQSEIAKTMGTSPSVVSQMKRGIGSARTFNEMVASANEVNPDFMKSFCLMLCQGNFELDTVEEMAEQLMRIAEFVKKGELKAKKTKVA